MNSILMFVSVSVLILYCQHCTHVSNNTYPFVYDKSSYLLNSCKHEGYSEYNFPESWGSDVKNYAQMEDCGEVPPDGDG